MKEIGGYFELECRSGGTLHEGVLLNSSRNALRYIIRSYGIRKIHIPAYTCHVLLDAIREESCEIVTYDLDETMMPARDFAADDFIVYNNYFGVCGHNVDTLAACYENLIVDNAQSFYAKQKGLAAFYSPRKFFGLPDGGIAIGKNLKPAELLTAKSYDICSHLLKRHDLDASLAYTDFKINDDALVGLPVEGMSNLTRALMGNIDYASVAQKRRANFVYLHDCLHSTFPFAMSDDDVPMAYPYVTSDPKLRAHLIEKKIFVAKYWPGLTSAADELANRIIPLPIDQRYGVMDMRRIVEVING